MLPEAGPKREGRGGTEAVVVRAKGETTMMAEPPIEDVGSPFVPVVEDVEEVVPHRPLPKPQSDYKVGGRLHTCMSTWASLDPWAFNVV